MKQIGEIVSHAISPLSPQNSVTAPRGPLPRNMPEVLNRTTDIEIPRSAWSSWTEFGKPRKLRRALTDDERLALIKRQNEIAPWVAGYQGRHEENRVALALADMFASFRSMRYLEANAVSQIDGVRRMLAPFPAWAIEKACHSLQQNGVWRNGAFDKQWPPNDSEIVAEVRDKMRLYGDQYNSAVALLSAEIEEL